MTGRKYTEDAVRGNVLCCTHSSPLIQVFGLRGKKYLEKTHVWNMQTFPKEKAPTQAINEMLVPNDNRKTNKKLFHAFFGSAESLVAIGTLLREERWPLSLWDFQHC